MASTRIWPSPKVVVIGGGTGTSTILQGLKNHTDEITAIISVMDDGGSTGRLRKDLDIIATGDIRSCLLSLSNTDGVLDKLLKYRFDEGELSGHSFGNIFIAAMYGLYNDFGDAIAETAKILNITGRVLPITLDNANLVALLEDGSIVRGESTIPEESHKANSKIKKIFTDPDDIYMLKEAKDAILEADIIILGPGSLYTSIIPNLLAKDMGDLLKQSAGKVVYVANIMGQMGETEDYSVRDHYDAIIDHSCEDLIDYVIVNNGVIDPKLLERYKKSFSNKIEFRIEDKNYLEEKGVKVIATPLIRVKNGVIRHDADILADIIFRDILFGGKK